MAHNPLMAQRIRESLQRQRAAFTEKKMFSGICFMVDDKMCLGTHTDKVTGLELVLCRMSNTDCDAALRQPHVIPMEFTGRAMKGYVFVQEPAITSDADMDLWVEKCLTFNPVAKRSKK